MELAALARCCYAALPTIRAPGERTCWANLLLYSCASTAEAADERGFANSHL